MEETRRSSANESAAQSTHTDAGAAKGRRRRASNGSTTSTAAGTASHMVELRLLQRVVRQRDLERSRDRRENNQQIEPVAPRECYEPAHALNVLHARVYRVLPE